MVTRARAKRIYIYLYLYIYYIYKHKYIYILCVASSAIVGKSYYCTMMAKSCTTHLQSGFFLFFSPAQSPTPSGVPHPAAFLTETGVFCLGGLGLSTSTVSYHNVVDYVVFVVVITCAVWRLSSFC